MLSGGNQSNLAQIWPSTAACGELIMLQIFMRHRHSSGSSALAKHSNSSSGPNGLVYLLCYFKISFEISFFSVKLAKFSLFCPQTFNFTCCHFCHVTLAPSSSEKSRRASALASSAADVTCDSKKTFVVSAWLQLFCIRHFPLSFVRPTANLPFSLGKPFVSIQRRAGQG